jgi:CTD kinase subunit alpha
MKDSWSHGDDRRDRGRVDRGVTRLRRSPSPAGRRHETERDGKHRDRGRSVKEEESSHSKSRHKDQSKDRRRALSRSPARSEDYRERNRGRELIDSRSSGKTRRDSHQHQPSSKRHKSRSPSRDREHRKKSRRSSRSPVRVESESKSRGSRVDNTRRQRSPARPRSPPPRDLSVRDSERKRERADVPDRRRRSASPRRERDSSRGRGTPPRRGTESRKRSPTPLRSIPNRERRERRGSPPAKSSNQRTRNDEYRPDRRSRSPKVDRYEPSNSSRPVSPAPPRGPRGPSTSSSRPKRERPARDEYRPQRASGANSIEIDDEKMVGRGGFGHPGYPNPQMQAAFPLKQQYNQSPRPQIDTRQYSQSPQHITPNSSYHNSPQAHSPYSAGRGWGGQPQQFSPQQYVSQLPHENSSNYFASQYPPNYNQGGFPPQNGPQALYYPPPTQSPQYPGSGGPVQHTPQHVQQHLQQHPQQNFRGGGGRGFRGGYRGRGHFQNLHWNANSSNNNQGGAGRGQTQSGSATPQHASPQAPPPPPPPDTEEPKTPIDEDEDLFRPSKDLQVEDTSKKTMDEEAMPPPGRAPPTGPQANKFSFAFKASSKPAATPKPEISQKLTVAAPFREPPKSSQASPPRQSASRPIPTEPASSRARSDYRDSRGPRDFRDNRDSREPRESRLPAPPREPPAPRKIKKIMRRQKPRPTLPTEFAKSDSVYFRKPGNESVVGSGTYGKVFKAIHVYTKKLVALKKIRMEGERDGFPVTAVREIKLLQSLKHPNVVNLQEVMVEKNDCFMVFEYLSHDLTGLLNHPTFKLEPAHKKHLAKQLFEGLDYLHRRGVLHRDIKAANILVSNEGQLKLADFGLARFYAKRRQLDYTNRVITIWYRSPELLLGETQYGAAVDIWSAACVLVEIFTRHSIFPGDGGEINQLEKIYNILGTPNRRDWPGLVDMAWFELLRPTVRKPNVFAEKYKDRVTPAAYELLEAMFQYDPEKRPSAGDVLEHPYFTTEEPEPRQAIE